MRQESSPPTGRHESSESIGGLKDTSHLKKHVARYSSAPSADRLLPTDTASRRSLETCVARNSLDQAARVRPRLSDCRGSGASGRILRRGIPDYSSYSLSPSMPLGSSRASEESGFRVPCTPSASVPLSGLWVTRTIDPARFKRGDERWEFNREGDPPCATTIDACHEHRVASHSHGAKRITVVAALHQSR